MKRISAAHLFRKGMLLPAAVIFFFFATGRVMAGEIALLPTFHDEDTGSNPVPQDFFKEPEIKVIPKAYSFQAMASLDLCLLTPGTGNSLFPGDYAAAGLLIEQDVYKGMIGIELLVRSDNNVTGTPFVSYTTGDAVSSQRNIYDRYGAGIRYMFQNKSILFPYASLRWVYSAVNVRFTDPYEAVSVSSMANGIAPVIGVDMHARKTVRGLRPFFNFNMEMGYSYMPVQNMGMLGKIDVSTLWFDIGIGILFQ